MTGAAASLVRSFRRCAVGLHGVALWLHPFEGLRFVSAVSKDGVELRDGVAEACLLKLLDGDAPSVCDEAGASNPFCRGLRSN